jgi:sensor domain CHASE-containing protein
VGIAIGWEKVRTSKDRVYVRTKAEALALALRLSVHPAESASEALGSMVRQSAGTAPDFQVLGNELLSAHAGVASLELAPGGVVSDVVPRSGNERALGFSLLKDPPRRAGASAASQRRRVTLAGPLRLYSGEPGIAALMPVYMRAGDGHESCWGFASASMRLSEVLTRAGVNHLAEDGYNYSLDAAGSIQSGRIVLSEFGQSSLADPVLQPIDLGNVELRLALAPRGGWLNRIRLAVDLVLALFVSFLFAVITAMAGYQKELQAAWVAGSQQLLQGSEQHKQIAEESRSSMEAAAAAQTELKQLRAAAQQTEANAAELKTRLEQAEHKAAGTVQSLESMFKQAETRAGEFQVQLEAQTRAASHDKREHEQQLQQLRSASADLEQKLRDSQARLHAAAEAHKQVLAAGEAQAERDRAVIEELKAQVAAAEKAEVKTAVAAPAQLDEIQDKNRELTARLAEAESRAEELSTRLRETESELNRLQDSRAAKPQGPASSEAGERSKIKAKKPPGSDQLDFFGDEGAPARPLPPAPPVKLPELRKAVHDILPLLVDNDPGAKDCLKDNRNTFRSTFTPEAYVEFARLVSAGKFAPALEQLKKAVKHHGISV